MMSALPHPQAVENHDEMTDDKRGETPRQADRDQTEKTGASKEQANGDASNNVAGIRAGSEVTVSEQQSQSVDGQNADEIPSDMTDAFAQMLELRNKDPAMFERLMRAVQGQSSPLPSGSPAPSATKASRAASSVASTRGASPAHHTFSHVGIKSGNAVDRKSEKGKETATSAAQKGGDGDEAQSTLNSATQDQKSVHLKFSDKTQLSSRPAEDQTGAATLPQSASATAGQKPSRRPFFSEARRLGLSRATSQYLSTKAANAGKDFSPEFCYSILTPDSEGFGRICEKLEEAGLSLDRVEYAKVLMTALRIQPQTGSAGPTPSNPPNVQTRMQPQAVQQPQSPSSRLSGPIDIPHGLPAVHPDPIQQQPSAPSIPSTHPQPGMQTSWPRPPSASIAYSPPGTVIPTSQPQSGAHTFFPFPPQPVPNASTSFFQPMSREYAVNSQYSGPAYGPPPRGAASTQFHPGQPGSPFPPLPQQVQQPNGITPVGTPPSGPGVVPRGGFPEPVPPGFFPGQRNPYQRTVPQVGLQPVQHNQGPPGQFLVQRWSGPESTPRGRGKEPQKQQTQIPYYPLPPQLVGKLGTPVPAPIPPGVKRGRPPAPPPVNGTHEFIQYPAKKPRFSDGTGASRDDQMTQPQMPVPHPSGGGIPAYTLKSRPDLVMKIDREKTLRNMTYDPATIARDILIAAGRHPTERPLNEHLKVLQEFSCVGNDSDLATFRWDIVDPVDNAPPDAKTTQDNSNTTKEEDKHKEPTARTQSEEEGKQEESVAEKQSEEEEGQQEPATSKQSEDEPQKGAMSEQHEDQQTSEDERKHDENITREKPNEKLAPAAKLLADFLGVGKEADSGTEEKPDSKTAT